MSEKSTDQLLLFSQFIDFYYPSIYSAITKLTGLADQKELETITMDVFDELWKTREQVLNELRPPAFIYKVLIRHVFTYLRKQGEDDRIMALQNILYSLPDTDHPAADAGQDTKR
jgi:DNA-directed RNA polymerase specialized sigma24 family protein